MIIRNTRLLGGDDPAEEATFYVGGDVYILWSEFLNTNITIYADRDIHFIHVSDTALIPNEDVYDKFYVTGKNTNCKIPLLAEFDCKNTRNELKSNNLPSVNKGFIYSNGEIKTHSAASNITFQGGISGQNVYLSGVAGQVHSNNEFLAIWPQSGLPLKTSYHRVFIHNATNYTKISNGVGGQNYRINDNLINGCIATGVADGKIYMVNENYRFPTVVTQKEFSSRIKVESSAETLQYSLEKRIIFENDAPIHMNRSAN